MVQDAVSHSMVVVFSFLFCASSFFSVMTTQVSGPRVEEITAKMLEYAVRHSKGGNAAEGLDPLKVFFCTLFWNRLFFVCLR